MSNFGETGMPADHW